MRLWHGRLFAAAALTALAVLATPGNAVGQLGAGFARSRVVYNDTVIWRAFRYNLPALIFEVPPDPDGDQWAFAHILEHNRMAVEFANVEGGGDLELLEVFAGSLDEGGGPLQDVIVRASPEVLPFVDVEVSDFSFTVRTTAAIVTDGGFIEVTMVR